MLFSAILRVVGHTEDTDNVLFIIKNQQHILSRGNKT